MIEVESKITIYEVDGEDTGVDQPVLSVLSHWNNGDMVVLKSPNGTKFTVVSKDLVAAIRNATR